MAEQPLSPKSIKSRFSQLIEGYMRRDNISEAHARTKVAAGEIIRRAKEKSETDDLTGLYNRRGLSNRLNDFQSLLNRKGGTVTMYMFDLDKFKSINDNYDHPGGDMVLKGFATMLKKSVRSFDIVARPGGDEFIAVIYNGDVDFTEKFKARIEQGLQVFSGAYPHLNEIGVSIGYSHTEKPELDRKELMRRADRALYMAKQLTKEAGKVGLTKWEPAFDR